MTANKISPPRLRLLSLIAPGLLVAATGVGAGDLATGAFTGARLGVAVLWAVLLGAFLKFVLTEGLTRWQLATGETLLEGAVRRFGRPVEVVFIAYLILWSFCVGSALMSACGVATHALLPFIEDPTRGKIVYGMATSLLGVALVLLGGFPLFEKVMGACIAVMFAVMLATAALLCDDWSAVARGMLLPRVSDGEGGVGWTVALIGGVGGTLTVLCYGYWIREKGRSGGRYLAACRTDLGVAYIATALFGMAMVLIGSVTPVEGKGVGLIVNLADRLEGTLGGAGRWAFLLGAWAAVFSSLLGVWQSVPYLFADFCRMARSRRCGGDAPAVDTRGRAYRIYLISIALVPMAGLFSSFEQVQKTYAILGALSMPLLAGLLLRMNGRAAWVGAMYRNSPLTAAVLAGTLLLFLVFGVLQIVRSWGS
ncbi:MAG: Nramp family divalent metal transporter [Planctomycetota bacterium]